MPSLPRVLSAVLLAVVATPAAADEVSDKQKKVAEANLKKAEVRKAAVVETDHFIVAATVPEDRAKALGAALEKVYPVARKALQVEEKETVWKGKLTVYLLTDRKEYTLFMLSVAGERAQGSHHFALRADEPYLVYGPETGAKVADADLFAAVAALVGSAVFQGKGGMTEFPEWVRSGFGRAAALRADGPNGQRYVSYRSQARRAVLGGSGRPPATVNDVWGEVRAANADVLATSLMDYIAFGPGAANGAGLKFINGFRPTEDKPIPAVASALEAAGWKPETLDAGWKKWVQSGK